MIEFNSHIEDLIFDPVTRKYRVGGSHSAIKTKSDSQSSVKNRDQKKMTIKIKHKKSKQTQNLIEKKGLYVDFMVN